MRETLRPPFWIVGTSALGIVLSVALFVTIRRWERDEMESRVSELVGEQISNLRLSMLRSIEVLYSIASLHATKQAIERKEFQAFVKRALNRQPELLALSWNPTIRRTERESFEAQLGTTIRENGPTGQMVRAADRPQFVPVCFIEPASGNAAAIGYDLRSDVLREQALDRALETGLPIGTAPLRLAQTASTEPGFLVVLPAFAGPLPKTASERQQRIAGFAVAVFRVADLVKGFLSTLEKAGLNVEIRDATQNGALIVSNQRGMTPRYGTAELEFAEHRWKIYYEPTSTYNRTIGIQSWIALLAGLAFTGLTTAYLTTGWQRTADVGRALASLGTEMIERKRAERAADAANKAKSDFLASMSHEIRTPLNAILGYTQLLQRDPDLSSEHRDSVFGIRASGNHLLGLISEVLDLSKIEAGRMELHAIDFDMQMFARSIEATFRPLCAQKRIQLRVFVHSTTRRRVRGDEGKLRQIIINLVGNAVKFTTHGEVYVGITSINGSRWRFEVVDTGLGIPEEERPHIFEPFHQGKGAQHQGGTGLGLAIARRQVEVMGGNLEFDSKRGNGTRFFFTIEVPDAHGQGAPPANDETEVDRSLVTQGFDTFAIPEELFARLMTAAELHSATALKANLQELRAQFPDSAKFCDAVRDLMRRYDMEGIQRLLSGVASVRKVEVNDGAPDAS